MARNPENLVVIKRILARVLIVVALYPILLGGVANMPQRYRARWRQMRQEHIDAVARDRARSRIRHENERGNSQGASEAAGKGTR